MPTPFYAMPDHLRPLQGTSERALLEQRARIALADERSQLRHERRNRKRQSGRMGIAAVRLACAICLLLVVLVALASKAPAMPGSRPQVTLSGSEKWRSGGDHVVVTGVTSGSGHRDTRQPRETFDWADASVGAAFGVVLVPFLAGGIWLLNRGWVRAQLPARRSAHDARARERRTTGAAPAHSPRRFATLLSALFADDGMRARFAAERHHDEDLVRRVESRRP